MSVNDRSGLLPYAKFPWPNVPDSCSVPIWDGYRFMVDGSSLPILEYAAGDSGWSDALTALHEAEASSDHPIDLASRRAAMATLRTLPGHPIVLDIGASSGFLIAEIRENCPNAAVIGADYLSSIVHQTARRLPGVPFLQFDLQNCPLPDHCVDAVTALNVLEHIADDERALREIFRILRPGGCAHIEVPAGPQNFDFYDEVLMHQRRYRQPDLVRVVRRIGFRVTQASHLGWSIYPAFWYVKQRNRRLYVSATPEIKQTKVRQQIQRTAASPMLKTVLRIEGSIGRHLNPGFGIRVILRLIKPVGPVNDDVPAPAATSRR